MTAEEIINALLTKGDMPSSRALPPLEAPADLVAELSSRYVKLYEMITGETFEVPASSSDVNERMRNALKGVL